MTEVTCAECCVVFQRPTRARSKYCGNSCRTAATRRSHQTAHARNSEDPDYIAARRKASRANYAALKSDPAAWQAHLDRQAERRKQNPEKEAEYGRRFRQRHPDKIQAKNERRRARLLAAYVEDVSRAVLRDRDGDACSICREDMDFCLSWPDKQSVTLDHVIPLSRGGAHSYVNCRLAHAVCNSRKNNRLDYVDNTLPDEEIGTA